MALTKKQREQMHALKVEQNRLTRQKVRSEFFLEFTRFVRPWVQTLADTYKRKLSMPLYPIAILPSFYTDRKDKEIAAYAALLLNVDASMRKIQAFRDMLGDSPYLWFRDKDYLKYAAGSQQMVLIGGVRAWKVAELFERLWDQCHGESGRTMCKEIEKTVMAKFGCSFENALDHLADECISSYDSQYKIRLLMMVLLTKGGIGQKVYDIGKEELHCPFDRDVWRFLKMLMPDRSKIGTEDECVRLFGLEYDSDFLYAALAYKELMKKRPEACARFSTLYYKWYEDRRKLTKTIWNNVLDPLRK